MRHGNLLSGGKTVGYWWNAAVNQASRGELSISTIPGWHPRLKLIIMVPTSAAISQARPLMLQKLLSIEMLPVFVLGGGAFGVVLLISWLFVDESIEHRILITSASLIVYVVLLVSKAPVVRDALYQLRQRLRSPIYEVNAGGMIWTTSQDDGPVLLKRGLTVAKNTFKAAKAESTFSNRMLILAGRSRSIRLDLNEETQDDSQENEDHAEGQRRVDFLIRGYRSKVAQIANEIDKEIAPFIENLTREIQEGSSSPNFWLNIHLPGSNPFLKFYLRDIPNAEVGKFQIELIDCPGGNPVNVKILEQGFNISARTPLGLSQSARRYLFTPALSDGDRD